MITATAIPGNRFAVRTSVPVRGRIQSFIAASEGEAIRLANVWIKLYIIEKLTSWLLQRAFAYKLANMVNTYQVADKLLWQLSNCHHLSLNNLMRWVAANEKTFRFLAPGEKSRHYKFYSNTIAGILDYCQGKEMAQ